MSELYCQVAVSTPLYRVFDYRIPSTLLSNKSIKVSPGIRVKVPFRRGNMIGVIYNIDTQPSIDRSKIKDVVEILDHIPIITKDILKLSKWAIDYYHGFPGEMLTMCLPKLLREGEKIKYSGEKLWQIKSSISDTICLKRAPRQQEIFNIISENKTGLSERNLPEPHTSYKQAIKGLIQKGLITEIKIPVSLISGNKEDKNTDKILNKQQKEAVEKISEGLSTFSPYLLYGITGSGKTEVFIRVIRKVLESGKQALILVPEIGLTPQLINRFAASFNAKIAVIHSSLTDNERLNSWIAAKTGDAQIIIGTRSALFTPLQNPGIIVIDEEHDASFKQQDSIRFSARDLAVIRAQLCSIPIVLASATPSFESLQNSKNEKYQTLLLTERATGASKPTFTVIDIRNQKLNGGLSNKIIHTVRNHLEQNGQVLIFLNRRGYAPVLMCHSCGWSAKCNRCDVNLTVHHKDYRLRCHHCGKEQRIPTACPECNESSLQPLGKGTEKIEETLKQIFPDYSTVRIDRDTTSRKGSFDEIMTDVHKGKYQILLGTQMLAKGHHIANISLVVILDIDSALFSCDFRATEKLGQLITQVAGRSGREKRKGEVAIQTHHPDSPILHTLLSNGYNSLFNSIIQERKQTNLPPFSSMAIIKAEALSETAPYKFLEKAKEITEKSAVNNVDIFGPIPNIMQKKAGHHRAQLIIQSKSRSQLQKLLKFLVGNLENEKSRKVRWVIDVDPIEVI